MGLSIGISLSITGTLTILDEGGGGAPGGALVSSDFKNGVYSIGGVSKTVEEVWAENADFQPFDPALIVAGVGLTGTTSAKGPALTAAAKADLLGGFVAVLDYSVAADNTQIALVEMFLLDLPNWSAAYWTRFYLNGGFDGSTIGDLGSVSSPLVTTVGTHRCALRFASDALVASIDGGANVTTAMPADNSTATDVGVDLTASSGASAILEKIEFFALADYTAADLPTLSA
jgi:hypothetical protein